MNHRKASQGKWLTQANLLDEESRIFAKHLTGASNLKALFTEWTDDQKTEWESQHKLQDYDA